VNHRVSVDARHDWSQYNGTVDLVAGARPARGFIVAGKRLWLDDPRGNLSIHFLRVVDAVKPRWFLYENVPGLLSNGNGEDFEALLGLAEQIGHACCWRVLNSKYFGVPQGRRRLFIIGCLGAVWEPSATVLLEPDSAAGDSLAGRKAWQKAPRRARRGPSAGSEKKCDSVAYGLAICGRDKGAVPECQANAAYALRTAGGGSSDGMVMYAADMRHATVSTMEIMTLQVGNKK
jgi:site-specific DNA-cytosine methylase